MIVQPDTVVRWHRQGYRLFWRWRSSGKPGRPRIPAKHIAFNQRMSRENPLWGEDRIAQEFLLKLGIQHSSSTIRRYMISDGRSPSNTWRSFLPNHASEIYALDLTSQVMCEVSICYVLVMIDHRTRRLVHIGMTRNPTLNSVKQQIRDACPWQGPKFIIHDNDGSSVSMGGARGFDAHWTRGFGR